MSENKKNLDNKQNKKKKIEIENNKSNHNSNKNKKNTSIDNDVNTAEQIKQKILEEKNSKKTNSINNFILNIVSVLRSVSGLILVIYISLFILIYSNVLRNFEEKIHSTRLNYDMLLYSMQMKSFNIDYDEIKKQTNAKSVVTEKITAVDTVIGEKTIKALLIGISSNDSNFLNTDTFDKTKANVSMKFMKNLKDPDIQNMLIVLSPGAQLDLKINNTFEMREIAYQDFPFVIYLDMEQYDKLLSQDPNISDEEKNKINTLYFTFSEFTDEELKTDESSQKSKAEEISKKRLDTLIEIAEQNDLILSLNQNKMLENNEKNTKIEATKLLIIQNIIIIVLYVLLFIIEQRLRIKQNKPFIDIKDNKKYKNIIKNTLLTLFVVIATIYMYNFFDLFYFKQIGIYIKYDLLTLLIPILTAIIFLTLAEQFKKKTNKKIDNI